MVLGLLALAAQPAHGLDCYTEIAPNYLETDVRSLIHADTRSEVERIRSELISYIWKSSQLPEDLPEVEIDVANPFSVFNDVANLGRVDRLTVRSDGFTSNMYLLIPERPRRRLMIFHQGHGAVGAANGIGTVRHFLAERYPVLVVHMPMYGPNLDPWGTTIFFHNLMPALETPTLSPIRYFLDPVVGAVNYARRVLRHKRINMIGVSGGGWTTTLAAAVDPRIDLSVAVAGSLPLFLRTPPCEQSPTAGDFEQHHPPLMAIADYLDLYVLASSGRGRAHLQVINQFDACCFAGVRHHTYAEILDDVVDRLSGDYFLYTDRSHQQHQISPHALDEVIDPFFKRRRPPRGAH